MKIKRIKIAAILAVSSMVLFGCGSNKDQDGLLTEEHLRMTALGYNSGFIEGVFWAKTNNSPHGSYMDEMDLALNRGVEVITNRFLITKPE